MTVPGGAARVRVLVVDDRASKRYLIATAFRLAGFEPLEAATGEEALRLVDPDLGLVVLDVKMPDMDGFELLARLKAEPRLASIPVIQVSAAFIEPEDQVRSLEAGADAYLPSPNADVLLATARALLRMRRAEQERAEANRLREEALRQVEQERRRLREVLESLPVAVALVEASDGRITVLNPAMEKLWLGAGPRRYVPGDPVDVAPLHRRDGTVFPAEERPAARAIREGVASQRVEGRLQQADGSWAEVEVSAQPLLDDQGQVSAVVVSALDVTASLRAEQARTELEQQLLAIVSHDLRNPLGAILLGATALGRREDVDGRTLQTATRIRSAAERASRMVEDLLDFTQARLGGGIRVSRRPADLKPVVREVLAEVEAAYPERTLRLKTEGSVTGEWDPDRLGQVVQNLVTNALKYGRESTPVEVTLEGRDGVVRLAVHNQGSRIPPESLGLLFQPMRRGENATDSASRSVGLGLYIVKQVVRAHDGSVEVQSTDSDGTTFVVTLPRVLPPQ